jgi:hypothetical protein
MEVLCVAQWLTNFLYSSDKSMPWSFTTRSRRCKRICNMQSRSYGDSCLLNSWGVWARIVGIPGALRIAAALVSLRRCRWRGREAMRSLRRGTTWHCQHRVPNITHCRVYLKEITHDGI